MRIISFNVQFRRREPAARLRRRMSSIADFLLQLNPDLICLQEVTPAAWAVLSDRLQPLFAEFCPRDDGVRMGEAAPVLCLSDGWKPVARHSFWFSETPDRPSKAWGAAHPRVCSALKMQPNTFAGPPLWVMSLHLDHHSRQARIHSLDLLEQQVCEFRGAGAEVVVCGDFNMPAYRRPMRELLGAGGPLRDATHLHPVHSLTPTYLGWSPLRLARARIDHCLHSQGWAVDAYETLMPRYRDSRLLSDHRALQVDLSPSGA